MKQVTVTNGKQTVTISTVHLPTFKNCGYEVVGKKKADVVEQKPTKKTTKPVTKQEAKDNGTI